MSIDSGTLYVVATPIGNLDDFSPRALRILKEVDIIAAEDTRHSRKLLAHFGITTPASSYHDFNQARAEGVLVTRLLSGQDVALISDAGTPLISDPGFKLIKAAHEKHIRVVPVPGPSALIAALSVAGLPTDRFVFEGFAPEKKITRQKRLKSLADEQRTLVFFEAPHRVSAFLEDASAIFGPERLATLARELTKLYETVRRDSLGGLAAWLLEHPQQVKGEFVIVIAGADPQGKLSLRETDRILAALLGELPLKQAAGLAARITGEKKNVLYRRALELEKKS